MLAYCDYIAHLIHNYIKPHDAQGLLFNVDRPRYDLDKSGALNGTKKTLEVTDVNGKRYRVTVEEVESTVKELVDGVNDALKTLTIRGNQDDLI